MDSALPQLTAAEAAAHLQGRAGLAIDRQRQVARGASKAALCCPLPPAAPRPYLHSSSSQTAAPQALPAGIELTEGRLALALQELEVAREHEQTELAKRAAGLQQRYQERVAELERQFLLQVRPGFGLSSFSQLCQAGGQLRRARMRMLARGHAVLTICDAATQAEALQQELVQGITEETAKSQKVLPQRGFACRWHMKPGLQESASL